MEDCSCIALNSRDQRESHTPRSRIHFAPESDDAIVFENTRSTTRRSTWRTQHRASRTHGRRRCDAVRKLKNGDAVMATMIRKVCILTRAELERWSPACKVRVLSRHSEPEQTDDLYLFARPGFVPLFLFCCGLSKKYRHQDETRVAVGGSAVVRMYLLICCPNVREENRHVQAESFLTNIGSLRRYSRRSVPGGRSLPPEILPGCICPLRQDIRGSMLL